MVFSSLLTACFILTQLMCFEFKLFFLFPPCRLQVLYLHTVKWFYFSSEQSCYSAFRIFCCCSVTKSCLTLQPLGLQHTRLPCPSLFPGICLNACPLSQWCHLTISSSAALFPFCLQSFPTSESLTVKLFTWVAKVIGAFQHQSFQWLFRVDFL